MKSYSIVLVIVLSLASLSVVAWIGGQPAKPAAPAGAPAPTEDDLPLPSSGPYGKAEVEEKEFKFGSRGVGEKDVHTFKIKNVGEGTLAFKLGKPTCQCTVGEITRENGDVIQEGPIAPGETINILVKWDMKMQNEKFRQIVPVFTTDPDHRKIEFAISGAIVSLFEFRPEGVWNVGDITSDPVHAEGYIVSKTLSEFKLEVEPKDSNSNVKITIEPLEGPALEFREAKSGYHIVAEVGTDIPVGRFREPVKLHATSAEGHRDADFTVIGNRPGPIEVRGVVGEAAFNADSDRLLFKDFLAKNGAKATMTVFIKGFDGDFAINSVEPENSRIKVTLLDKVTMLGKTRAYKILFEILPGPPESHRGVDAESIILKLNHPQVPDFRLMIDYNATR